MTLNGQSDSEPMYVWVGWYQPPPNHPPAPCPQDIHVFLSLEAAERWTYDPAFSARHRGPFNGGRHYTRCEAS